MGLQISFSGDDDFTTMLINKTTIPKSYFRVFRNPYEFVSPCVGETDFRGAYFTGGTTCLASGNYIYFVKIGNVLLSLIPWLKKCRVKATILIHLWLNGLLKVKNTFARRRREKMSAQKSE